MTETTIDDKIDLKLTPEQERAMDDFYSWQRNSQNYDLEGFFERAQETSRRIAEENQSRYST